jgi:rubrerythrin
MNGYICKHCRFVIEKGKPRECPWCGRDSLEPQRSAGELLDDVEETLRE